MISCFLVETSFNSFCFGIILDHSINCVDPVARVQLSKVGFGCSKRDGALILLC